MFFPKNDNPEYVYHDLWLLALYSLRIQFDMEIL